MKLSLSLVVVALALVFDFGWCSDCHDRYGGSCLNSLLNCPSGYHVTFSYCGFLQICCFSGQTSATGHGTSSSSSGHGSSGTTSTGHQGGTSSGSNSGKTGTGNSGGTSVSTHNTGSSSTSQPQCGISQVNSNVKIVGGTTALNHEFPWQVSLMYNGQHLCGGTLIDNQWVLSAAHCFENTYKDLWRVALGVHDSHLIYRSNYLSVEHIYVHSNFNARGHNNNDIAILKLEKPVDISGTSIRAACLPDANETFDNEMCTVTGWGSEVEDGSAKRYLQKVSIPILSNDICNYYLGRGVVSSSNLCAGFRQGGKDACQGDSGGPLVCKRNGQWKLAGIVSYGFGCGERYAPGVYTRVSSYLDWINSAKTQS